MPPKVAAAGYKSLPGKFKSRMHENYEVSIYDSAKEAQIEKFWTVGDNVLNLAERLAVKVPASGAELTRIAHEEGCEDMFPSLTKEEKSENYTACLHPSVFSRAESLTSSTERELSDTYFLRSSTQKST